MHCVHHALASHVNPEIFQGLPDPKSLLFLCIDYHRRQLLQLMTCMCGLVAMYMYTVMYYCEKFSHISLYEKYTKY